MNMISELLHTDKLPVPRPEGAVDRFAAESWSLRLRSSHSHLSVASRAAAEVTKLSTLHSSAALRDWNGDKAQPWQIPANPQAYLTAEKSLTSDAQNADRE